MPRTRQTQSGAPAQPIGAVAGQEYGMGVQEMALQRAMPAPQTAGAQPPQTAAPNAPAPAQQPSMEDVLAQVQGRVPPGGLIAAPTTRPDEPVTHGLPSGPGGGPEVIGSPQASQVGAFYRRLSQVTGNGYFAALADRSNL